ncbi:MAG: hypothetical protein EOP83_02820 [Verrucomicrobiaceae bacterium]|nr:MAG: hypothetical protein EOP83_02820 [Verrucomicrobiaceae bacterium]
MIKSVNETHFGIHFTHAVLLTDIDDGEQTIAQMDAAWAWIIQNTPGTVEGDPAYPIGYRTAYPIVENLPPRVEDGWTHYDQEYWIGFTCYEDAFAFLMRFG